VDTVAHGLSGHVWGERFFRGSYTFKGLPYDLRLHRRAPRESWTH
jgi:hypothetical protein